MDRLTRPLLMAAFLALLAPPLLAPVPPLLDYPNHLARWHILVDAMVHGRDHPYYEVAWGQAWINSAVDMLAVALGALLGADRAGTVILCLAIVLPPAGAVALNRVIFRGWHWWQIGFPMLSWNGSLVIGLISFQIGIGLAFVLAAWGHARLRKRGPVVRFVARAAASALLLLVHPFAAAFHAVLLGGLALGRRAPWRGGPGWIGRRGVAIGLAALACALPVFLYLAVTPVPPGSALPEGMEPPGVDVAGTAARVVAAVMPLLAGVMTYDIPVDIAFTIGFLLIMAAGAASARGHAGLLSAAAGIAALSVIAPGYFLDNGMTNWRIGATIPLTLAMSLHPGASVFRDRSVMRVGAVALGLAVVLRAGWIGAVWYRSQTDVAAVVRTLARAEPDSKILIADAISSSEEAAELPIHRTTATRFPLYWHVPALAAARRSAFVPTLFAMAGKQPLRVRPALAALTALDAKPTSVINLAVPEDELQSYIDRTPQMYFWRYLRRWRDDFDYVLLLNADQPPRGEADARVPAGDLLADEGFAQLWRIRRR